MAYYSRKLLLLALCGLLVQLLVVDKADAWFWSDDNDGEERDADKFSYDSSLAKKLARYCASTYKEKHSDSDLEHWNCEVCRDHLQDFAISRVVSDDTTGGRSVVGYDRDLHAIVVAFRGNANAENWLHTAKFKRVRPKPITSSSRAGLVHSGFLKIYKSLRDRLLSSIKKLVRQHPGASFRITGHSMGGSQAIFLSLDLKLIYPQKDVIMYNFGSPRVGNSRFKTFYDGKVEKAIRVVHRLDLTKNLPPNILGYKHVGEEYVDDTKLGNHCVYVRVRISGCNTYGRRRKRYIPY